MKWTTKDGTKIEISKLDDKHLLNIKKFIERRAVEGVVACGGHYWDAEDNSYWEDTFFGEEVKQMLGYRSIVKEIAKRNLALEGG